MRPLTSAFLALAFLGSLDAQPVIRTIAGREWLFPAQKQRALGAPIGQVVGLAYDSAGNLYFADSGNHMVLRIDPEGWLTVVAGNGVRGYSGDGGPATQASLEDPHGVAVDRQGNIYISEYFAARLRKITPDGRISTLAASPLIGHPEQLATDAAGNLYVAERGGQRILRFSSAGSMAVLAGTMGQIGFSPDGTLATEAKLQLPRGITLDKNGIVYFADTWAGRVRRINRDGRLETVAGVGSDGLDIGTSAKQARISQLDHIAFGPDGLLYMSLGMGVVRIGPTGVLEAVTGLDAWFNGGDGGLAERSSFSGVTGIAFHPNGNLEIGVVNRIRQVAANGIVDTIAGGDLYRQTPNGTRSADAYFSEPWEIDFEGDGSLLIADSRSSYIRRLRPSGIVQIAAGNGQRGPFALTGNAQQFGIGNPTAVLAEPGGGMVIGEEWAQRIMRVSATGAFTTLPTDSERRAVFPRGLVKDSGGNLYFSGAISCLVSRLSPAGALETVAGNGTCSSTGDGGPATKATVNLPSGLAIDKSGQLYIAEEGGGRIRRVRTDGTVETFAGGGSLLNDGVPANLANIRAPIDVAIDASGNVYFSESQGHVVRYVTPQGIIRTLAGRGTPGYSGDGGFASLARLNRPIGLAIDTTGNIYIADSANGVIRMVTNPTATNNNENNQFQLSSRRITLSDAGPEKVIIGSTDPGLPFTATVTSPAPWLRIEPASGATPAVLSLETQPAGLSAGVYTATVRIASGLNGVTPIDIAVTLTVTPAATARVSASTTQLNFSISNRISQSSSQSLQLTSTGAAATNFTAETEGIGGLTIQPRDGNVSAIAPVTLRAVLTPSNLSAGIYAGAITIRAAGSTIRIPVKATISESAPNLLLSQSGLTYNAVEKAGQPLPQSIGVLNIGGGAIDWTARAATVSGVPWLGLSTMSGRVERPFLDVSELEITVDTSSLVAGEHYGRVEVHSNAPNSPQIVTVLATVLPPGSNPGPEVRPTGLIFTGLARSAPGSQSVIVGNTTTTALRFASSRLTLDGINWFQQTPASGVIENKQPATIILQPNFAELSAGVRRGVLTMQFEDGAVRTVNLLSVVAPVGAQPLKGSVRQAVSCGSDTLQVLFSQPRTDSVVFAGQPANFEVRAIDECGNPLVANPAQASAEVKLVFSNGEPTVPLAHVGNGIWKGTWRPISPAQRVTVRAVGFLSSGSRIQLGVAELNIGVQVRTGTPILQSTGVVHAASQSPDVPFTPGGLFTVYGKELAGQPNFANALPLPRTLDGVEALLGDRPLSLLYTSSGQINVQVPYDIPPNTIHQLTIRRGTVVSTPESISIAAAAPGVFTTDQSGKGQGHIYIAGPNGSQTLAAPANPAKAGDVLVIYCSGLGVVDPPVAAGDPAPISPLSITRMPVTVLIGGQTAKVTFSGLTPKSAGLYQVNVEMPAGLSAGTASVVLVAGNQVSSPVTIAVAP